MAQAVEDVRQQVAVIVAEREYPASPGPLCGYCDFLEMCREGVGQREGGQELSSMRWT